MNEKVTKNPLKVNDDDSLGKALIKTTAQAGLSSMATYIGIVGSFALVGWVSNKIESIKSDKKSESNEDWSPLLFFFHNRKKNIPYNEE